jgi:hypothetical protein
MSNLFEKAAAANNSKYKNFYVEVESLYNNLKQKYDPNRQHDSIFKARGIENGDKIVITAETNDGGVIKETVAINEESTKPLETKSQNPIGIEHFNVDDFDEEWNGVDNESISSKGSDSIETVSSGNLSQEDINNDFLMEKTYNVNDYINELSNLNSLSNEIYDTLHRIYTDNIVIFTTKIIKDEKVLRFIEHVNKIITLFTTYIDNSFKYYNTIISGSNLRFESGEIKRKNEHIKNELNKFDNHYKDFINNVNKKNSNDYKNIIIYEKDFLLVIVESSNFLYNTINDKKSLFENKPISYSFYIDTNKMLIEKIKEYKKEFYALYNAIFSVNNSQIKPIRPLSADVNSIIKNKPLLTSRSDINRYPSNITPAVNKLFPALTQKNNPKRRGGSINPNKKNTRKRNPNKNYNISRKVKNSLNIMKKKLQTKKRIM